MSDSDEPAEAARANETSQVPPVVDVTRLFGDRREIVLELEGGRYRLRITWRNKLILQK